MINEGLLSPRPGPGVCVDCFTFTRAGFDRCLVCDRMERHLGAVIPIAYSVAGESLHRDIASYKRDADLSVNAAVKRLARLLDQFLAAHETCVAAASGIARFDVVTTVPSRHTRPGERHPLEGVVETRVAATAGRHRRLLLHSSAPRTPRTSRRFDAARFSVVEPLGGAHVLLIDDMWTSGATAQSAARALKSGGAASVTAVVIGRHLKRSWGQNDLRLPEFAVPLDFTECALCADATYRSAQRQLAR
jgi:predicted amidophosphoribosyltransferase